MARVSLLTPETAPGENGTLLRSLARHGADVHPLLRAVAHSEGCFRNFLRLPDSLIRFSRLSPKLREIVVMRIAQQQGSEYEWSLHERYALAAGISAAELEQLRTGNVGADEFDELERLVVRFTDEALAGRTSGETFSRISAQIGEESMIELVLSLGWWAGLVPLINNALDIHLEDE
jgi:alkylhydroperoxidase family enzyme